MSKAEIASLLQSTTRMPAEPEMRFRPDADTAYARTAEVLETVKTSGVSNFGFVDNQRFGSFPR